jgi:hypothetical protein
MNDTDFNTAEPLHSKSLGTGLEGKQVADPHPDPSRIPPEPIHLGPSPRVGGQWNGRVEISPDFDEIPEDFFFESEGEGWK